MGALFLTALAGDRAPREKLKGVGGPPMPYRW
jgi:hypothetical protein